MDLPAILLTLKALHLAFCITQHLSSNCSEYHLLFILPAPHLFCCSNCFLSPYLLHRYYCLIYLPDSITNTTYCITYTKQSPLQNCLQ
jgi:hypothetical protein